MLTGDFSHTGGTTIAAGSLHIGQNNALGSIAGDITVDTDLWFERVCTATP